MEGKKSNKNKKATTNTSKKTRIKKVNNEVSSEELLEQIMSKKKTSKKSTTKKVSTVSSASKSTPKKSVSKKKTLSSVENDDIYEKILTNKKTKKKIEKKSKELKKNDSFNDLLLDKTKTIEELEALFSIEEERETKKSDKIEVNTLPKYDTYNSLEESVKRKKEQKDEFELFLTEIENEKLLRQIREALEEDKVEYIQPDYKVHSKDAIATIDSEINERIKSRALGPKVRKRKHNIIPLLLFLIFICIGILFCIIVNFIVDNDDTNIDMKDKVFEIEDVSLKEQKLLNEYNNCIGRIFDDNDNNYDINIEIDKLNEYLEDSYDLSIKYVDITSGFSYGYNEESVYYAASTMKTLAALYVYEKAFNGELDLDSEVVYTKNMKMSYSYGMSAHKIGSKIKLRDLVKYSITLSDNTAHKMIVNYIGVQNIRNYGLEMGATLSHTDYDLFGYINVSDAKIYLDKLYYLINNTGDYGVELEEYFFVADQNLLNLDEYNISAIHKYGEYSKNFHEIGIIYDEHPYSVVILTNEGKEDYVSIIKDVNNRIYQLHSAFYNNRKNYCQDLVYK